MIRYPKESLNKETSELKRLVDERKIKVGQRFFIGENPVTCIHIDGQKYIFSMDEVFKSVPCDRIAKVLKTIYDTGGVDDINIFPDNVIKDIDFLFVPCERQVFGKNKYGYLEENEQFEWFKRGDYTRVKGYKANDIDKNSFPTSNWWLGTKSNLYHSSYNCYVTSYGEVSYSASKDEQIGVPIFFQMTSQQEE